LDALRRLVAWLEAAGHERIILVDNDSSYEPLLCYYGESPHQVLRLGRNVGHLAAWDADVLATIGYSGQFVVTDCDVVPDDEAPRDAVDRFAEILGRHPEVDKVGFGLRIDDLPSTYRFRGDVILWESQFWEREVEPAVFRADLDTTFALYRPGAPRGSRRALRTGPPYVARHLPWYLDSGHLTEEEEYYRRYMRSHVSNWNLDELPTELRTAIDARRPVPAAPSPTMSHAPVRQPPLGIRVPGVETETWFVRTDQRGGFWDLFAAGRWEPETIALIVSLARPGTSFVDVGAWLGPLSIIAAKRGAQVVAYEPAPVALEVMGWNLSLNSDAAPRIRVVPKAIAGRAGGFRMSSTELGDSMSSIVHGGAATASIEAVDARAWSGTPEFLTADILKIDIEGAEFVVLPRLHRAFRTHRPVLLLSVHGYHLLERFARLTGRPRWAAQHVVSLAGRVRILRATRGYHHVWQWDRDQARWQPLTGHRRRRFLLSMADTELVLSDGDLPPGIAATQPA
jgi:FkbM family methyltransferase